MIDGIFRDGHPRASVTLVGDDGTFEIECIIDTGFEGALAISGRIARRLGGYASGFTDRMLADGSISVCPFFTVEIEMDEERHLVEALVIGGNCLLGTTLFQNHVLHIEVVNNGSVLAEPI